MPLNQGHAKIIIKINSDLVCHTLTPIVGVQFIFIYCYFRTASLYKQTGCLLYSQSVFALVIYTQILI